jgi:hypothetical protein
MALVTILHEHWTHVLFKKLIRRGELRGGNSRDQEKGKNGDAERQKGHGDAAGT